MKFFTEYSYSALLYRVRPGITIYCCEIQSALLLKSCQMSTSL